MVGGHVSSGSAPVTSMSSIMNIDNESLGTTLWGGDSADNNLQRTKQEHLNYVI